MIGRKSTAVARRSLQVKIEVQLSAIKRMPQLIRSFFKAPSVAEYHPTVNKRLFLTMLPTDHYRSVDGAVPRRVSRTRLLAPRSFRAILPAMDKDVPRAHHDLGGVSKFLCEPVDVEPHALTDFDKEVDALRAVLGMKRVMTVDEMRRGIEAIPEAEYHRLSYYRRWMRSITDNLLAKGVITEAELRAALDARVMADSPPARACG